MLNKSRVQDSRTVTETYPRPLVIAHRGASGQAPENTLAAFKLAVALGADGVEMDVQLSADHHPVVIHDSRVNRTTNSTGLVSSLTVSQLGQLDAGGWFERRLAARTGRSASGFSGEPVPTLDVVLETLAPANLRRIYIELKSAPESRRALAEAVVKLVRNLRLGRAVTLLSFDHEAIKQAKEIAPEIRTAATFPISGRALITANSVLRATKAIAADEAALHYSLASPRAVSALHESEIAVSAWTANSSLIMRRLISCGVDSIMTNYPARLLGAIESPPARRFVIVRNK